MPPREIIDNDTVDFDPVHINTEFSDQASDHDPPIVRFTLDD